VDYQLTSSAHSSEQEEYKKLNRESEIFSQILKRVELGESVAEFKDMQGLHPDVYKENYAKFLRQRVE